MNRRGFVRRSLAAAIGASLPASGALAAILSPSMRVDADIDAVTGDGASVTLKRAAVQELGESLRGNLLLPGHPVYDDARRVLNASISKFPALIVQPRGAADIRRAVDFARASNLLVAVKCGGHSHSGKSTCDGGLMIDLSLMRGVRVDPAERIAYVSGGSLLGDMDNETMRSASSRPPARCRTRAWPGSRSAAASAAWRGASACRSTTCAPSTSSPPTASCATRAPTRTPSSSGACAAAAATSAS